MYALKIRIGQDDWLYVTEDNKNCSYDYLKPVLYETFEHANQAAEVWRLKDNKIFVKVVEYEKT